MQKHKKLSKPSRVWSGKRGSNPPPPPWQGGALPNELFPHMRLKFRKMERVMGLEPTISAWKANVLPLHYTRVLSCKWCGRRDLNSYALRHWNLNPARLPIPPRPQAYYSNLVTRRRFELRTPWLKVKCSTDWASKPKLVRVKRFELLTHALEGRCSIQLS